MDYQVLPLKYRPQTLDELWIQEHIKTTLKKAIKDKRVAHAYLFAGPRGVGKTTTARILAKSLNCVRGPTLNPCQKCSVCQEITNSQSLDVIEIDGASNRGIDQIRELRENIKYLPTSCPYKIYIIDEVHMLTEQAFNALLKTLEEPPKHVKFIFATTAPHKVPSTILSRCQRFDFHRASVEDIVKRLRWIADQEKIKISEESLYAIGKRADGSIRDAESILDQLRAYKPEGIELKDVEDLLGIISSVIFFEYTDIVLKTMDKDIEAEREMLEFLDKVFASGYDFMEFFSGLLEHFRLLLMVKLGVKQHRLDIIPSDYPKLASQAQRLSQEKIIAMMKFIADNENDVKRSTEPKILFEILSLRLMNLFATTTGFSETASVNPHTEIDSSRVLATSPTKTKSTSNLIDQNTFQSAEQDKAQTNQVDKTSTSKQTPSNKFSDSDKSMVSDLSKLWQCMLTELKDRRPYLANYLEETAVDKIVDDTLTIILNPRLALDHKDFIEQEKSVIEKCLSEIRKKPTRISLQVASVNVNKVSLTEHDTKEPSISQNDSAQSTPSTSTAESTQSTDPEAIFKKVFPDCKRIK